LVKIPRRHKECEGLRLKWFGESLNANDLITEFFDNPVLRMLNTGVK
jgi:hypothetical protein